MFFIIKCKQNILFLINHFCLIFRGGSHNESHGLGVERPSELRQNDDEFDAYRKRMMLAYRFRPNPLVMYIFKFCHSFICNSYT